ncbi:restriction endonuclease subunit S [Lactobacillus mulieris]|uniref:restriction endonuclease subunit S n=1 Tax=Lactobacillus mulieris TaxID=2508708 RepID=UPI0001B95A84|nr:restriction endonuclease subunit S [Lactobacillus mulieris]EEX24204.1 type I restriction modification DNA specificity domain protein [Lactobacillus jensenii 115-3-CHN]KAA9366247.1 restriction endonuclease subunit S [Lactobacillus jensenii]MCW8073640.1 restriction endonuclease subunit S [Lactobacillus mulieris]
MYPKVRFRGFDEPWKKVKLGQIADVRDGTHESPKYVSQNGYPLITSKNLENGTINFDDISYISKKDYEEINKRSLVEKNDILFGMIGTIGNVAIVKKSGFAIKNVALIKSNSEIPSINLIQIIQSDIFKKYTNRLNSGNSQKFISLGDIRKFDFKMASKSENMLISKLFKKVDTLLSLQQRKLELEKQLKKFCLQNILSDNKKCPNLRFHDFSTNWKKVKVGDIFTVTRGKVLSKDKISKTKDHIMKYPVYSSQTLNNGLLGYYHDYLFEDAITWTTDGANAGTVRLRAGKFYGTNVNGVLLSKNGYVNDANAEALNQIAWKYVSKVGNPKLMNNVMQNIMFSIAPSVEEQVIISKLFILHSKSLKIYQANINVYTQLKQFLLQNLFI